MSELTDREANRKLEAAVKLYQEFGSTEYWEDMEDPFWQLFNSYIALSDLGSDTLPHSVIQDRVVEAFDLLGTAFFWTDHGGFDYWLSVRNNLEPLLPAGHPTSTYLPIESSPERVMNNAERLADLLETAFDWESVEPGFDYWDRVYGELLRIASEG